MAASPLLAGLRGTGARRRPNYRCKEVILPAHPSGVPLWPGRRLPSLFVIGLLWAAAPGAGAAPAPFAFADVAARAEALAAKPFVPPAPIPKFLRSLAAEKWRRIDYLPKKALWRGQNLPFELQFFHPGYLYEQTVPINIISEYGVGQWMFEKKLFSYPEPELRKRVPPDLGYAGYRIYYPLERTSPSTKIAVFLGASYFHAVGLGQVFGLSARGLAVDTGLSKGEEFPYFKEFWLRQPTADAEKITVYALLDSASVTGAYRFVIDPGRSTVIDVQARLFARKNIKKLGVAPLTSMFLFSETRDRGLTDYRPEVHNSDGLMIAAGDGEWIWRPLRNPDRLAINSFTGKGLKGFGLMQRDRHFAHYQDLDAHFERRPSAWVVPLGDWGPGRVELVQIPSDHQRNDNIVAYWVPKKAVKAGQSLDFAYRLFWQRLDPQRPPAGYVTATRIGQASGQGDAAPAPKLVVDFAGPELAKLPADAEVGAYVDVGINGKVGGVRVIKNQISGGWRLIFTVKLDDQDHPLEMRAYLTGADGGALTETWSYALRQ